MMRAPILRLPIHSLILLGLVAPVPAIVHAQVDLTYQGRLGFTDARHTSDTDEQRSTVVGVSDPGYTAGTSVRFVGAPTPDDPPLVDQSAWMGSPEGGTKSIGFYDATHTSASGYHTSEVVKLTRSGRAAGYSIRYNGQTVSRGRTAWIASWGGGTRRIGLFYDNEEPPELTGTLDNYIVDMNEAGQVIGYAPKIRGQEAWISDASGVTRKLGFYDLAHQSSHYEPYNTPVAINPSGTIIGHSLWSGGQVVWLHSKNGGPPVQIGLYSSEYASDTGEVWNIAEALNAHGFVLGRARRSLEPWYTAWLRRPDGSMTLWDYGVTEDSDLILADSGYVAGETYRQTDSMCWIYSPESGETHQVGLELPGWDYLYYNHVLGLAENGVAVGRAAYDRATYAWIARPDGTTVTVGFHYDLGLPGAERSEITDFANTGVAIGISYRGGMDGGGRTGWIVSPETLRTYRIGLEDVVHLGPPNPYGERNQFTQPTHVTRSRFVAGYNVRYHGDDTAEGQTAWIYNSPKGRYARLELSVRPSDGYAFSVVNQLLESGVAVGRYTKFAEDGTDLGDRAFVWITGKGAFDIGEHLDVDPESVNWDYLADAVLASPSGYIAGHGVPLESTSQGVFLVRLIR